MQRPERALFGGSGILGAVLLVFVLTASPASASVDVTWVWCDADARANDAVTYCIEEGTFLAGDLAAWKKFIADAAQMWTDKSSWSITQEPDNDCSKAHVKIRQDTGVKGTGATDPIKRADGKCLEMVRIALRKRALDDKFWSADPEDPKGQNNPLNCIQHELGHAILLNDTKAKADVMYQSNQDILELSDEDVKEAGDAEDVELPKEKDQQVQPSSQDQTVAFADTVVVVPAGALSHPTILGIHPLSPRSTPSFNDGLPPGIDRMLPGVSLFTTDFVPPTVDEPIVFSDVFFDPPVTVHLGYSEEDLSDWRFLGHQRSGDEPFRPLDESSLTVLVYDSLLKEWSPLPSVADRAANRVSFESSGLNAVFAIGGREADLPIPTEIVSLCLVSDVPAATLLFPYFEVDLSEPAGLTTLLAIGNAAAAPAVAQVTLWTDLAVPTVTFQIYLTGLDVQTLNLRDVFAGDLPVTADRNDDPSDSLSPHGPFSQDLPVPGCEGVLPVPGGLPEQDMSLRKELDPLTVAHLQAAHTGQMSPQTGACYGVAYGDQHARGFVTVDAVERCSLLFPSDAGYFTAVASDSNVLVGDFFLVTPGENFAQGDTAVHVRADPTSFGPDAPGGGLGPTFYGRLESLADQGSDHRQPLPSAFATRYLSGGVFTGGTRLIVWRDIGSSSLSPFPCGGLPPWAPLPLVPALVLDEEENGVAFPGGLSSFPWATQAVTVGGPDLPTPEPFGIMFLDFDVFAGPAVGTGQAWVLPVMSAQDRFSVGFPAWALRSPCSPAPVADLP